jgi:hypothetical protein
MSTVTTYKTLGTNLSDICNTLDQAYYGNIVTNYSQSGIDLGSILSMQTFPTVSGTITTCGYTTPIITTYNTGLTGFIASNSPSGNWTSCAMSSTGQYAIGCIYGDPYIYISSNYGQSWTANLPINTTSLYTSVSISSSGQYCYAATFYTVAESESEIWRSSDFGVTWNRSTYPVATGGDIKWTCVSISSSGQYGIACATNDKIYYTNNFGGNWYYFYTNSITTNWTSVSISSSGQYGVACATAGRTWYSNDYGQSWTVSSSPITNYNWTAISISSSGKYGIACATGGQIWFSNDYGQSWNSSNPATVAGWSSISISSTGQYGIAGITGNGTIYCSNNYGVDWSASTGGARTVAISKSGLYCIAGVYGNQIYYTSNSSTITSQLDLTTVFEPLYKYKTNTWSLLTGVTGTGGGIATSYTGQNIIISTSNGSNNITRYSRNYGQTWNTSTGTGVYTFYKIAISNTGQYAFAGTDPIYSNGNLYYSSNYGQSWALVNGGGLNVAMSSSGRFLAFCFGDTVYISTNSGTTWSNPPTYLPDVPNDNTNCSTISMSSSGQYIITMGYDANGIISNYPIFYSSNYGTSFSYVFVSPAINTRWRSSSMSSSGQYAIACSYGVLYANIPNKIYYSNTYGATWTVSNSPSLVNWVSVSMSSSGQYALAGTASTTATGNNIYYSSNYGVDWTLINVDGPDASSVSISGNGQYAFSLFGYTSSYPTIVYKCTATN